MLAFNMTSFVVTQMRLMLEGVIKENAARGHLAGIGGNFVLVIPAHAVWTVVTSGARAGVYEGATDDFVHFALLCEAELLTSLLDVEEEVDLAPHIDRGRIIL